MKHRVSELEGALLDAAVAKSLQRHWEIDAGLCFVRLDKPTERPAGPLGTGDWDSRVFLAAFSPSSEWRDGGPIIERESVAVWKADGDWCATIPGDSAYPGDCDYIDVTRRDGSSGPTPLIAAMRAFVSSKFGEEVEL